MKWRRISPDTSETSTGWRVYRARLPEDHFFITKGKVRRRTGDRDLMLEIVNGGDYGDSKPY